MRTTSYKLKLLTSYLVHVMIFCCWDQTHFVEADKTENERCQEKILSTYPDAKCSLAKDPDDCKMICEKYGAEKCKDTKGEIKKNEYQAAGKAVVEKAQHNITPHQGISVG